MLTFNDIKDGNQFEELVLAYFEELSNERDNRINNVTTKLSGSGPDGGRDILVEYQFSDGIVLFNRTWVVQCKFHEKAVSPSQINKINIPTLLQSYDAVGYLLVCKTRPTSGITNLFERLCSNKDNFCYEFWTGEQLIKKVMLHQKLINLYFPSSKFQSKIRKK